MKWNFLSPVLPTNIDELFSLVLKNRNIEDKELFLHPLSPLDLSPAQVNIDELKIQEAVKRIQTACEKKEKIIIFGDYDCDGVCSTAILWETLFEMGCNVLPFIPHRERHGYGLSKKALDEIFEQGKPDIIISVDNGIVAHEQWQRVKDEGVFGILTDHHEPENTLPPADIIIHTTKLCGTTVAWMLAKALNPKKAADTLDLCAIATIADQVPLTDANRSFASFGLKQLNATKRVGLKLLIETAGLRVGELDAGSINYAIAPRINAMGRLEHALDALRAICTRNEAKARELIAKLQFVNQSRQDLTFRLIEKARLQQEQWKEESIIIIADEEFHEGVIGLIAGRLTEEFSKPTIVFAKGEKTSKASARSVKGVNITELLRQIQSDLLEVGGHPMAAGVKVETAKLDLVTKKLQQLAREQIDSELLHSHIDIECALPPTLMTIEAAKAIATLAPFGTGNRPPIFAFNAMQVVKADCVGKEGKHLKLMVMPKVGDSNQPISVIGFGKGNLCSEVLEHPEIDIAGTLEVNGWNGKSSVQIVLKDTKIC